MNKISNSSIQLNRRASDAPTGILKPLDAKALMETFAEVHAAPRATDVSGESPPNRPVGEIEPLVDEEILNGLRKWLDEADLREVLTRVPEEAERCFDAIEAAIVAGDLTAAGKAAHGLAGMAANVGAKRLAAIAGGIANGMPTLEAVAGQMSALDHALKGTGAVLRSMT